MPFDYVTGLNTTSNFFQTPSGSSTFFQTPPSTLSFGTNNLGSAADLTGFQDTYQNLFGTPVGIGDGGPLAPFGIDLNNLPSLPPNAAQEIQDSWTFDIPYVSPEQIAQDFQNASSNTFLQQYLSTPFMRDFNTAKYGDLEQVKEVQEQNTGLHQLWQPLLGQAEFDSGVLSDIGPGFLTPGMGGINIGSNAIQAGNSPWNFTDSTGASGFPDGF